MEENTITPTICGLSLNHYAGHVEVAVEQYEDGGVDYADNEVLQIVQLGEFTPEEVEKIYMPLSEKVDGSKGDVTPEYIADLQAIIEQHR